MKLISYEDRHQMMVALADLLAVDMRAALAGTPFRDDAFDPFLAAADVSRTLPQKRVDARRKNSASVKRRSISLSSGFCPTGRCRMRPTS